MYFGFIFNIPDTEEYLSDGSMSSTNLESHKLATKLF